MPLILGLTFCWKDILLALIKHLDDSFLIAVHCVIVTEVGDLGLETWGYREESSFLTHSLFRKNGLETQIISWQNQKQK